MKAFMSDSAKWFVWHLAELYLWTPFHNLSLPKKKPGKQKPKRQMLDWEFFVIFGISWGRQPSGGLSE